MECEEECCRNCRFSSWYLARYVMPGMSHATEERVVLCRRMAPVSTGGRGIYTPRYGEHPRVLECDWCGQWEEKVDKAVSPA